MKFRYVTLTDVGLKRSDNEDSFGVYEVEKGLLVVVCDGLGGNKAGDVASKLAVETIAKTFQNLKNIEFLERIKLSILEANKIVMEESSKDFDRKGMATTVETLFLKDDTAYWGHVGDSRIYYLKDNKLKQLSKDHSLIQKLIDEGYLTLKEAENHPNKNIIMRALGDSENIEIDLSKLKISTTDFGKFFICTDGVTTVLQNDELEKILVNDNVHYISEVIANLVEKRGAPDNFTFVIITGG
ncbi:MAG: Stp1/IreP family PP2C-type Ser/Thr phosphatase [Ignavibacteriaceae bacterium]|jgi:protein phosphatase